MGKITEPNQTQSGWFIFALGCGMFFGIHNYFMSVLSYSLGNLAPMFAASGVLVAGLYMFSKQGFKIKTPLWVTMINVCSSLAADLLVAWTFKQCLSDKINQGIIATIFSAQAPLSAFLFYMIYKEALKFIHVVGITFATASAVFINFGGSGTYSFMAPSVAIACLCALLFAFRGLMTRYFSNNGVTDIGAMVVESQCSAALLWVGAFFYFFA